MESPHQVRAGAARAILLSALIVLVVCAVAAPAGAQRHSVRRTADNMSYGMSWSVMGLNLFPRPTAAPASAPPPSTARSSPARPGTPLHCRTSQA